VSPSSAPASLAEPETRRQPQIRAGQIVRADRAAPDAPPLRQVIRAARRDLGLFRGGGHSGRRLTPLRIISASTSARRYRGLLASLRTSGSRPRRAQDATAAEVTPNSDATSLRVIRSSPAAGPG
jgi:hypothetical protein